MKIKNVLFAAVAVCLVNLATPAFADIYTFTTSNTTTTGSFGTVTLVDNGAFVSVTVDPAGTVPFANTGDGNSTAYAFAFNMDSLNQYKITLTGGTATLMDKPNNGANTQTGLVYSASAIPTSGIVMPPFGSFNAGIGFTNFAKGGTAGLYSSSLTFNVSTVAAGGNVDISNFTKGTAGYLFSADLGLAEGTKNVVTTQNRTTPDGVPTNVPEPTTLALLGLGLMGFAVARRRMN